MKTNGRTGLYKLLFEKNSPFSEKPEMAVFETQTQLAALIVEEKRSEYEDINSLKGYLNQVLLGSRRCGDQLANAIIIAVLKKLAKSAIPPSQIEEVLRSQIEEDIREYHTRKIKNEEQIEKDEQGDYNALYNAQATSKSVFIINKRPLDLYPEDNDEILRLKSLTIIKIFENKIAHTYCVAEEDTAIRMWKYFFDILVKNYEQRQGALNDETIDNLGSQLEDYDRNGQINILVIEPDKCVFPVVLYDAERSTEKAFFYYARIDGRGIFRESCAQLDREQRCDFKTHFYNPIISERVVKERMTWGKVHEIIRKRRSNYESVK